MANTSEQEDTRRRKPIWLPVDLAKRLDAACKSLGTNRVEFVRNALDELTKRKKKSS